MLGQKGEQELSPSGEYWEQIPQNGTQKIQTKYNQNTKQNTKKHNTPAPQLPPPLNYFVIVARF